MYADISPDESDNDVMDNGIEIMESCGQYIIIKRIIIIVVDSWTIFVDFFRQNSFKWTYWKIC